MTPSRRHRRRSRESGYTLIAIMIFITLLTIAVLAVSPSVTMMMRRDREQELLFRGKQYAQGILNFQKRQGRFPLNLAELMKTQPRSARKLYKEPICDCADWGLIRVGQPWPPPPTTTNPADDGFGNSSSTSTTSSESPISNPGGGVQTRPGSPMPNTYTTPPPGGGGFDSGSPQNGNSSGGAAGAGGPGDVGGLNLGGNDNPQSNVPIIGVYSKVHKKGLQTFHGQEYYDTWGFIAGANNDPDLPGTQYQNPTAMFPNLRSTTSPPGGSTGSGGGNRPPPNF